MLLSLLRPLSLLAAVAGEVVLLVHTVVGMVVVAAGAVVPLMFLALVWPMVRTVCLLWSL